MRIGIAADHGGFELKQELVTRLRRAGHEVSDFGAAQLDPQDDYPDFAVLLGRALADGQVDRGIAVCGSGVGISIALNKIAGVRAALVHDAFSARQGVEDDDMNALCLGARVIGPELAWVLVQIFIDARFSNAERHVRRTAAVKALEKS